MYKILIADEKKHVRDLLRICLEGGKYEVLEASDGNEALTIISSLRPSIVLLQAELPVISGIKLCQQLREEGELPIILMVDHNKDELGIKGLELGADDFLTKPISTKEALARTEALLRRSYMLGEYKPLGKLQLKSLNIDLEENTVKAFDREISFKPREIELLWLLARNPQRTFSRAELFRLLWQKSNTVNLRTVDTHIKSIRSKLNIPSDSEWDIVTIWGVGYKFEYRNKA